MIGPIQIRFCRQSRRVNHVTGNRLVESTPGEIQRNYHPWKLPCSVPIRSLCHSLNQMPRMNESDGESGESGDTEIDIDMATDVPIPFSTLYPDDSPGLLDTPQLPWYETPLSPTPSSPSYSTRPATPVAHSHPIPTTGAGSGSGSRNNAHPERATFEDSSPHPPAEDLLVKTEALFPDLPPWSPPREDFQHDYPQASGSTTREGFRPSRYQASGRPHRDHPHSDSHNQDSAPRHRRHQGPDSHYQDSRSTDSRGRTTRPHRGHHTQRSSRRDGHLTVANCELVERLRKEHQKVSERRLGRWFPHLNISRELQNCPNVRFTRDTTDGTMCWEYESEKKVQRQVLRAVRAGKRSLTDIQYQTHRSFRVVRNALNELVAARHLFRCPNGEWAIFSDAPERTTPSKPRTDSRD